MPLESIISGNKPLITCKNCYNHLIVNNKIINIKFQANNSIVKCNKVLIIKRISCKFCCNVIGFKILRIIDDDHHKFKVKNNLKGKIFFDYSEIVYNNERMVGDVS